ncbi:hypothetical protein CZ774_05345 [Frigoribacterium sp. JB110]|nr:hypothetical protein CZ774_05345 [Frigoribacterium sp. JB110]
MFHSRLPRCALIVEMRRFRALLEREQRISRACADNLIPESTPT